MTIWAICCYFNPAGYRSKKLNYDLFRARLSVPLISVELAYGAQFELGTGDAEYLIQLYGRDVMWQKERLLNIALQALPPECSAVAWLDADIVLEQADWPALTLAALQSRGFVQPFGEALDLGPGQSLADSPQLSPQSLSVAAALHRQGLPPDYFATQGLSQGLGLAPGRAWAARRELLDRHGFYDAMIVGGGDRAMLNALMGETEAFIHSYGLSEPHAIHYRAWAQPLAGLGPPAYVPGRLTHLWHGSLAQRAYQNRQVILAESDFDPRLDICHDPGQAWRWASRKPALHARVAAYFEARCEDGLISPLR